jgi:hypothetical protein
VPGLIYSHEWIQMCGSNHGGKRDTLTSDFRPVRLFATRTFSRWMDPSSLLVVLFIMSLNAFTLARRHSIRNEHDLLRKFQRGKARKWPRFEELERTHVLFVKRTF